MSRAISSPRASSAAAAAFRYRPRTASGEAAQPAKASVAAATAASASASPDAENSPTTSDGRIGFVRVYVSPEADGTHAPPT